MPLYKPSSPSLLEICTKQSQNPRYSLPCGERRRLQLLAGRILGWKKVKFPTGPYRAVGVHRLVVETGADHVERRHRHRHGHAAHHAPRQHRGPAALPEPLREAAAVSRARHFGDWTRCMPDAHRCWILVQDPAGYWCRIAGYSPGARRPSPWRRRRWRAARPSPRPREAQRPTPPATAPPRRAACRCSRRHPRCSGKRQNLG